MFWMFNFSHHSTLWWHQVLNCELYVDPCLACCSGHLWVCCECAFPIFAFLNERRWSFSPADSVSRKKSSCETFQHAGVAFTHGWNLITVMVLVSWFIYSFPLALSFVHLCHKSDVIIESSYLLTLPTHLFGIPDKLPSIYCIYIVLCQIVFVSCTLFRFFLSLDYYIVHSTFSLTFSLCALKFYCVLWLCEPEHLKMWSGQCEVLDMQSSLSLIYVDLSQIMLDLHRTIKQLTNLWYKIMKVLLVIAQSRRWS